MENKSIKILFGILIIVTVIACFIIYSKFSKNSNEVLKNDIKNEEQYETQNEVQNEIQDEVKDEHNKENQGESENKESKVITLSNDDEIVKKLYSYILPKNEVTKESVYRNNKVTLKDISNELKLVTVYSSLNQKKDAYKKGIKHRYGVDEPAFYYKRELIQKRAKEIFGDDVILKDESLKNLLAKTFEYINGEYVEATVQGGGGYITEYTQNKLVKAEKKDDEIYLYDKYIYVENLDNMKHAIYCDSTKQKLIAKNVSNAPQIGNYLNNLYTYKHVFKKNEKGNYYWVSTEVFDK